MTKNHIAPYFNSLNQRNAMVPLLMWHWCQCQWYQITKSHFAPHLNCLDLRNAMLSFLVPLASYDVNTSANVGPHFVTNAVVPLMIPLALPDTGVCASDITWLKSHVIAFWAWPYKWSGAIDDTVGMKWHRCQYQWHDMTKRVMLHIFLIIITEEM